jgi:hypothetical protein
MHSYLHSKLLTIIGCRLSCRLFIGANSVLGLLHGVDVDEVADISETYAAFMFSVHPEYVSPKRWKHRPQLYVVTTKNRINITIITDLVKS